MKLGNFRSLALAGMLMLLTSVGAHATPVSIDFEFSPITVSFNGVTQSTGQIHMSIVTDTDNPNLGSGFGDFSNFYAATVFFTAPGLGLNNTRVVSPTFLYFGLGVVGFTDAVGGFSTIFTAFFDDQLAFGAPFDLSTLVVPQGPVQKSGTEFRTANQITFENGSFFDTGPNLAFTDQSNTVSVSAITAVPEPASAALLGAGLIGLVLVRRRTA